MKRTILTGVLLSIMLLTACAQNKTEAKKPESATEKKVGTIHLTKAEFLKKVVNYETNKDKWEYLGDKPCLIDFYTTWCGPCKMIAPILESLATEYAGQIYIYKIDTDKEPELAAAFGISSIPTLLFCPIGESPQMARGALPKETLVEAIETVLLKKKK